MVRSWITALLLVAAATHVAAVKPNLSVGNPRGLLGKRAPSPDVLTDRLVTLKTVTLPMSWQSLCHRKTLNRRQSSGNSTSGGITTISNPQQLAYVAEVTWGNQTFDMLLDTGSSDTWLLQEGFQCLSSNGTAIAQSNCPVGPQHSGNFTGGQIGNVNFHAGYGSASVSGAFGFEDITIAGLTVPNAQVALVDQAYFTSNVSGLFGLAFSGLTNEYPGTDTSKDTSSNQINYETVFYKMVDEHLTLPTFSFAPQRNGSNGYLAFGGVPPVNTTGATAAVPIITGTSRMKINQPFFYNISVDSIVFEGSKNSTLSAINTRFTAIVDSGTTALELPSALATALLSAYNPPATFGQAWGVYEVPCNATAPAVAITIGGVNFVISPADLIFQTLVDPTTGLCATGIQVSTEPYILGGVFMNNVLTTFDLGALQMRFTALA